MVYYKCEICQKSFSSSQRPRFKTEEMMWRESRHQSNWIRLRKMEMCEDCYMNKRFLEKMEK